MTRKVKQINRNLQTIGLKIDFVLESEKSIHRGPQKYSSLTSDPDKFGPYMIFPQVFFL